jgi:hypothetical protein
MADLTGILQAAAGNAAAAGEYEIERSLRFNSADSAYLNRTPASASNRKTWTWSGWVKRSAITNENHLFSAGSLASQWGTINLNASNLTIISTDNGINYQLVTSQVFRDPSAWYHLIIAFDTTQATSSNRIKVYVNGSQVTAFSTSTYPNQNLDTWYNSTTAHGIGRLFDGGSGYYFSGYLADINFIDGQALTPSSFGEINADTGVWSPIEYIGTYGTNGFYLNFSDNTSTTTLGDDLSGNGNDWTTNNFSVTAGAGNDSLVDSPTRYGTDTGAGGEVRGNYCTLNPLNTVSGTFTNGNLNVSIAADNTRIAVGNIAVSSGKWYWEVTPTSMTDNAAMIGISDASKSISDQRWTTANGWAYHGFNGNKFNNNSGAAYGATYTDNDVIGVALDMDAGSVTFYKNGSSQGVAYNTGLSGKTIQPMLGNGTANGAQVCTFNFGQRPFAYTAPSGFKALVTTNLPDPTVVQGDEYFNTVLYTGTGSSQSITGVGFQPDWVWIKERNAAADHGLYDAVRGVQNQLESNTTTAETAEATGLTAFGTDGFTVGALAQLNTSADTYVAWNWKANGAGVSNTAGTISSTVSVSTTSGFSIVTYTGTGSAATVGHGLGAVPRMIIVKNRDATDAWQVYHAANTAAPETDYLVLNTDAGSADSATRWNDTLPTSTVFSIGNGVEVNTNTEKYVAYCFAEVEGFSKFGSYTGNGSADGPFVYTGFRPAYVLVKRSNDVADWAVWDTTRDSFNVMDSILIPNTSAAEATNAAYNVDALSNGFKVRNTATSFNGSGSTFVFMAFASNPFKLSLAR